MKKILLYRWKAYNYKDIIEEFSRMDYEVTEVHQELYNYDVDAAFAERLYRMLREDTYEFVFSVNYFALISNVCQDVQIPYVCWSCDSPMISMYHQSVFHDCNRIFVFDRVNYEEFKGMGVEHIYYLPLAANVRRLDYLRSQVDPDMTPEFYANDVSFVGSLYEKNSYDALQYKLPEYLRGYFDALMEAQKDLQGANIIDRMLTTDILEQLQEYFVLEQSSEESFSDLGLVFSVTTLGFKIAQLQRKSILQKLSRRQQVGLYTASSTEDLPFVKYKGSVDYWSQMPRVFADSRINLNITIPNIRTGIPLRAWDIMASGGFLLSNFQVEYPMYFNLDEDLVCYYNEDDLMEKVDYYLAHEEQRQRIARNGYEKVKKYHTYDIRMQEMMKIIKQEGA
jgi:spore maturation protein CgeB